MLSAEQRIRYSRNMLVEDVGQAGQQALLSARVLVVGAGGLGSPLLLYLAAAGVGHLGIVDFDSIDPSNLQRQILFNQTDIGRNKADVARQKLFQLNPDGNYRAYPFRFDEDQANILFPQYDIIADTSDNFETRFLVNRMCIHHRKTLVSAAVQGWEGQLYVLAPYLPDQPCYQCLYPDSLRGSDLSCDQLGVIGATCGVMGSMQANEIIRLILNHEPHHLGSLFRINLRSGRFLKSHISLDPHCIHNGV